MIEFPFDSLTQSLDVSYTDFVTSYFRVFVEECDVEIELGKFIIIDLCAAQSSLASPLNRVTLTE